jgi:hypothetical protein
MNDGETFIHAHDAGDYVVTLHGRGGDISGAEVPPPSSPCVTESRSPVPVSTNTEAFFAASSGKGRKSYSSKNASYQTTWR